MSDGEQSQLASTQPQVLNALMPWFMGGPWVPKFSGGEEPYKFQEWRTQMEAFIRAQGLNVEQRVDFVLSALEGSAKREILLLTEENRDTDIKILDSLAGLYGGQQPVAQLRVQFFNCKQEAGEAVGAFSLRLRELHQKWRARDPLTEGTDDELLRTQFATGLRPGPVRQELLRLLRRNSALSFMDACKESKALEKELGPEEGFQVCPTFATPPLRTAATTGGKDQPANTADWQQIKDVLRAELQQELKEQITTLGKTLAEELRAHLGSSPAPQPPVAEMPPQSTWRQHPNTAPRRQRLGSAPPSQQLYQWDAQGRAICRDCGEAGHIQRFCPRRRPAQTVFRHPRSQQGE